MPDPIEQRPDKEPVRCPLKEIVQHQLALQIPPVNIVAASGGHVANAQRGLQRFNTMAGRETLPNRKHKHFKELIRLSCRFCK